MKMNNLEWSEVAGADGDAGIGRSLKPAAHWVRNLEYRVRKSADQHTASRRPAVGILCYPAAVDSAASSRLHLIAVQMESYHA